MEPQSSASASTSTLEANKAADAGEGTKILYMLMEHHQVEIRYSLFAIPLSIPNPLRPSPLTASQTQETPELFPILIFPSSEFPLHMRFVELDSKLYFIGGESYEDEEIIPFGRKYHRDVYVFDITTVTNDSTTYTTTPIPEASTSTCLTKAASMNSGKSFPSYVFAADEKIFVIDARYPRIEDFVSFESFDPRRNEWTALKSPPFRGFIQGQIVMGSTVVFFVDWDCIYRYDLKNDTWTRVPKFFRFGYCGPVLAEDTLYTTNRSEIWAYDRDGLDFFKDDVMIFADDVHEEFQRLPPDFFESMYSLIHIGERRFCFVAIGHDPILTPAGKCRGNFLLRIFIFQDARETYIAEDGRTCLKGKFLDLQRFHIKICLNTFGFLVDCFCVSSVAQSQTGKRKCDACGEGSHCAATCPKKPKMKPTEEGEEAAAAAFTLSGYADQG